MQSATHTDSTSVLKQIDSGSDASPTSLANAINNALFAPTNTFIPLDPEFSVVVQHTNTPAVTECYLCPKETHRP